jgi:microsomal dipeptidase-like Zn-dependent dipeptidase
MTKQELQDKMNKIMEKATRVYGTCQDGSFEACLHYEGYYALKKQIDDLLASELALERLSRL